MKKSLKSALLCAVVVLSFFALPVGSFAASPSESVAQAIRDTSDHLYALLEGDVSFSDGALIRDLVRSGKNCSALAEQLMNAEEDPPASQTPTFAQKAINAAVIRGCGLSRSLPEYGPDVDLSGENPYTLCAFLRLLTEESSLYGDRTETLITDILGVLKGYYNAGSGRGFDYYGYSADTNGLFFAAMQPHAGSDPELQGMLSDASAYLDRVGSENGYGFSEEYPEANASSTAAALSAFASAGDTDAAEKAFRNLMRFASGEEKGAFLYGGTSSSFASADALRAMLDYRGMLEESPAETPEQTGSPSTATPMEVPNPPTGAAPTAGGQILLSALMITAAVTVFRRRGRACR